MRRLLTILALLLWATSVEAAVALNVKGEAAANGSPASPRTVSVTVVANANRVVIGALFGSGSHGTTTATFAGNTMLSLGVVVTGTGRPYELFALKGDASIPTGAQTFSATYTSVPAVSGVGVWVFDGADQTTGWQNPTTNSGTTTPSTITITSANGNMVCAGEVDDNSVGRTLTAGISDWTETAFDGNYLGSHAASSGASTTLSWTNTNVSWAMNGVDIIATGGAACTPTMTLLGVGRCG